MHTVFQVDTKRGGADVEMLVKGHQASINDVFSQMDWLVQKYGIERVGLGSDFGGFDLLNQGLNDYSDFPSLAELFTRHGYGDDGIGRIMGENWYNFYTAHLSRQER